MKKKPRKKRITWSYEPPSFPRGQGSGKYYWYASGSGQRVDVYCVGRLTNTGEPFVSGLFMSPEQMSMDGEALMKTLDGAWYGPIKPPSTSTANWFVDWRRHHKDKP